jgi:hypothetical protein
MATSQITIQLSPTTLQPLIAAGYSLLAFQYVEATAAGGEPLVWLQTKSLAQNIVISWTPGYNAYVSSSPIAVNGGVVMSSMAPIADGQILQVNQDGSIAVTGGGPADAMSVLNATTTLYTCGLALGMGEGAYPIAAFPLYANSMVAIAPLDKVLLIFETYPAQTGRSSIAHWRRASWSRSRPASNARSVSTSTTAGRLAARPGVRSSHPTPR